MMVERRSDAFPSPVKNPSISAFFPPRNIFCKACEWFGDKGWRRNERRFFLSRRVRLSWAAGGKERRW